MEKIINEIMQWCQNDKEYLKELIDALQEIVNSEETTLNDIIDNNDNSEILIIVEELLWVVINDIKNMNDLITENDMLDLGNNKKISKDNFESLVSIIDVISEVLK